jgi:ADP-ribosyl-[dinitrogen reductase] hydrolase
LARNGSNQSQSTHVYRVVNTKSIIGCLVGTAVGDAIGLPCEGLSRTRQARLFGEITSHHLLLGRGMISDDTEHMCLVAHALIAAKGTLMTAKGDPEKFAQSLAWGLRGWFLSLSPGIGLATARACLRLLVGVSPTKSGVFSAGNGPAMRAPILGVCVPPDQLPDYICRSSRITHTDPLAEQGALAVAIAAQQFATGHPDLATLVATFPTLLAGLAESIGRGETTQDFATALQCPEYVTGYIAHTVPVALHAAYSHPENFEKAILAGITCGGDTDSVAAIIGGIVGAGVGIEGIPRTWREGLWDYPRNIAYLKQLGNALAEPDSISPPRIFLPALLLRNLFFLLVVLYHGLRRLLPW